MYPLTLQFSSVPSSESSLRVSVYFNHFHLFRKTKALSFPPNDLSDKPVEATRGVWQRLAPNNTRPPDNGMNVGPPGPMIQRRTPPHSSSSLPATSLLFPIYIRPSPQRSGFCQPFGVCHFALRESNHPWLFSQRTKALSHGIETSQVHVSF